MDYGEEGVHGPPERRIGYQGRRHWARGPSLTGQNRCSSLKSAS